MSDLSLSGFKAIVFDLDSTLTNTHGYPMRASKWLLEQLTDKADALMGSFRSVLVKRYRDGINRVVAGGEYRTPFHIVHAAMVDGLVSVGLKADSAIVDEAMQLFRRLHVENSTLNHGTKELLHALAPCVDSLGVITNSFEGNAQLILGKLDIDDFFQVVLDPGDTKAYKPMPQPFELAVQNLGCSVKETLFVGDEFYADIVGARSLGMPCVWVNARGSHLEPLLSLHGKKNAPSLTVTSMDELLGFV